MEQNQVSFVVASVVYAVAAVGATLIAADLILGR